MIQFVTLGFELLKLHGLKVFPDSDLELKTTNIYMFVCMYVSRIEITRLGH